LVLQQAPARAANIHLPATAAVSSCRLAYALRACPPAAEAAKEVLKENVSMPLLMADLFSQIPILRPLKVRQWRGQTGCRLMPTWHRVG
jgi:hypothetical protein